MPKRSILLIGIPVAAVAIIAVLALVLRPKPEPEHGGKKLSECVIQLAKPTTMGETRSAKEAITQMGTNALPYLIQWVGYETPTWKRQVFWAASRIFRTPPWQMTEQTQLLQRHGAVFALQMLGRKAAPGIPNLSRIANDPKRSEIRLDVVWVLGEIGAAALPGNRLRFDERAKPHGEIASDPHGVCLDYLPPCARGPENRSLGRTRFAEHARRPRPICKRERHYRTSRN